ncbi:MAG: hypothetical protein M3R63_03285 [Actinomycetota bacterium]|nr:hypothetical protein [Actinomycetota bacterium]
MRSGLNAAGSQLDSAWTWAITHTGGSSGHAVAVTSTIVSRCCAAAGGMAEVSTVPVVAFAVVRLPSIAAMSSSGSSRVATSPPTLARRTRTGQSLLRLSS